MEVVGWGNGKLTYPVTLMTADEVSFAGGLWATNAPVWYYYNSASDSITENTYWWTMNLYRFDGGSAYVLYVVGSTNLGFLGIDWVNIAYGIRPAISIKSCATWKSGNGDPFTPYEVEIDNTCVIKEN